MHGYKNINTKIVSFIPKYVKRQQIELVELFFFLLFFIGSINEKRLANDNLNMDIKKEKINKLNIACNLIEHNQTSPKSILSISTYYDI